MQRAVRHHRSGTQADRRALLRAPAVSTLKEVGPRVVALVAMAPVAVAPEAVAPVAADLEAMVPVETALGADQEVSREVAGAALRAEIPTTHLRAQRAWGCRIRRTQLGSAERS